MLQAVKIRIVSFGVHIPIVNSYLTNWRQNVPPETLVDSYQISWRRTLEDNNNNNGKNCSDA
jgi:hypothetical protein